MCHVAMIERRFHNRYVTFPEDIRSKNLEVAAKVLGSSHLWSLCSDFIRWFDRHLGRFQVWRGQLWGLWSAEECAADPLDFACVCGHSAGWTSGDLGRFWLRGQLQQGQAALHVDVVTAKVLHLQLLKVAALQDQGSGQVDLAQGYLRTTEIVSLLVVS